MEAVTDRPAAVTDRAAILEGVEGVLEPTGDPITCLMIRGIGPVLVDEPYAEFVARFAAFMNKTQPRGAVFHFTTFYSWQAEVNKLHQRHVKREPSVLTLDGCQAIDQITVEYITVKPIDLAGPPSIVKAPPYPIHGPGKRR
jgi:hypothetical protein